ncbi:hypothetical protein FHX44_114795 [Pseudonocardia hierapolitana]|uniref:Uncharacterized protein n=1 Tax=Pseudonocardia hierapolitana TaxID=1128676 RepID=A0A561SVK9_9PSEU|nr:hypothetical protein [Pseudonocardia hierapolitana]TWF78871.1 hypothetical protein FHX44_114795 [Pseudonocardia hierapolitana]
MNDVHGRSRPPAPAVPHGAWTGGHQPPEPSAGHGVVVAITLAISAALIAGSGAAGDGFLTLLVLLLAIGALVVPVAVLVTLWARARPAVRALLAGAGAACVLLLAWAVVRIVAVLPSVTFPWSL